MKTIFIKVFPCIVILLLGLPALMLFRKGLPVASGDFYVYLDPGSLLSSTFYSWNERLHGGFPNFAVAQIFPFFSFWWFFEKIGLSLVNIQRLWTYSYFVLSGFSIYFLVQYLGRKMEVPDGLPLKLGAILSASLYMINMFTGIDMFSPVLRPVQAVLPLIFLLWMKGLENRSIKYAVAICLVSLLYSSSNHNLAAVSPIYLIMFLYFIFFLLFKTHELVKIIKFGLVTLILLLLFNLWWIYPEFLALADISKGVQSAAASVSFLTSTPLLEALRFMGSWAWKSSYEGIPHFPYALKYDQFPLVFLTYLIPAFCFFCLLFSKKVKKEILFLELVLVIGLFFVKGILSPFGKIFSFLYRNFPGFWVYREPYTKFTLINVFSLACLLGLGFVFLIQEIRKRRLFVSRPKLANTLTLSLWIFLIGIILYNSYPFLTGEVVFDGHYKVMRSWYAKIPSYWKETKNWFETNDKQDWRLLVLPKAGYSHAYNWEVGMSTAAPVAHVLQEKPIVFYSSFPISVTEELVNKIYDILNFKRNDQLINVLSLLNVKYLLQQNDLDYNNQLSISTFSPNEMRKILSLYPETEKVASFGQLDIYQIKENFLKPKIFVPSQIVYSEVKLVDLIDFKLPFSLNDSVVFYSHDLTEGQKEKVELMANEIVATSSAIGKRGFLSDNPEVDFQKINPTEYKATVKNAQKPFFLTFSETFNNKWEAYINKTRISKENHLKVNGFSNGWLINKTGDFEIEIRYSGQKLLNIAYLISGTSLILSFIVLAVNIKRRKN